MKILRRFSPPGFGPSLPLFLLTASAAFAELPQKVPLREYTRLWTNSPFTTPPPPPAQGQEINPMDDYALGGVAPIPGGYRVTLLNRKKPDERISLPDSSDFKIVSVQYKAGEPLGTTVRLSSGGKEGTVAFDKTLLTLKAPAVQPQQPQQPQVAPQGIPGQPPVAQPPNGQAPPPRPPRPRVVAPAQPSAPGATPPNIPQPQARPNRR